jgi:uncharacterized protein (TIGR02453 family)
MIQKSTLDFLRELKKHNDKSWFDANRKRYETAKEDFTVFLQDIIDTHAKKDEGLTGLQAKSCLFRINRDIRFSKDKSPYKTNFGASVNRGGKKSVLAGYYFHLEPGEAFVGGGVWMPQPPELAKVRQEIDYGFDDFKKIVASKKFKTVYGEMYKGDDMMLSRVPKGYEPDNPAAEYLKMKSYIAMRPVTDKELLSKDLKKITLEAFAALQPLMGFLNTALA